MGRNRPARWLFVSLMRYRTKFIGGSAVVGKVLTVLIDENQLVGPKRVTKKDRNRWNLREMRLHSRSNSV